MQASVGTSDQFKVVLVTTFLWTAVRRVLHVIQTTIPTANDLVFLFAIAVIAVVIALFPCGVPLSCRSRPCCAFLFTSQASEFGGFPFSLLPFAKLELLLSLQLSLALQSLASSEFCSGLFFALPLLFTGFHL